MDLRQYFTKKVWWGKMIGAFFGFLTAGPIGALFGLLIGNFFDRGLVEHFTKPFWHYYNEKDANVKKVFFKSLFLILGHIAKSNGIVSKEDIKYANDIMHKMDLKTDNQKLAQDYFNEGKNKNFNLYSTLNDLQKAIGKKPILIRLFVDTQFQYIRKTGISINKLDILNNILGSLRLAPINNQSNFNSEFKWYETRQRSYRDSYYQNNQNSSSSRQNYNQWNSSVNIDDDYYKALGITSSANQQEVKRAYRRQISRNHPDKLIAKGLPEKDIKEANVKTQRISKAYEEICKIRGWK